jgi:hypothetical protein
MKKIFSAMLLVLALNVSAFAPTDFFTGTWEITIIGTPDGDGKLVTTLERKDGQLVGELSDPTGKIPDKVPIAKIEDNADKMTLYFTIQGYDVNMDLTKVDDDNLKGSVMGMFEARAVRK